MNNTSKPKQSRSTSKTKPLKKSTSTNILSNTTKPKKTSSIPKVKSAKSKDKLTKGENKKIKKSKSVDPIPICLTKNIEVINKLITNAQQITEEQDTLLANYSEITRKVTSHDYEVERILNKNENEDFITSLEKYSANLTNILAKVRQTSDESENIKCN
jgi:hypothetical protein